MSMTDPISDMLTRIRNAASASHESVSMPGSSVKATIAQVLKDEGYIADFETSETGVKRDLTVKLKYHEGEAVIESMQRVSKPGCRIYRSATDMPLVQGGLGIAIVSTSRGIMTARNARKQGVGGEILCTVS